MGFYGQGYSISRFLVEMGGRPRFLPFVRDGSSTGWDAAARTHYGLADVHELDRAWRSWHKVTAENGDRPANDRPRPRPVSRRWQGPLIENEPSSNGRRITKISIG